MVNPFPIQFLALLAYFILRVTVGLVLIHYGFRHIKHRASLKEIFSFRFFPYGTFVVWWLALFEIGIGIALFLGFSTQIAALLLCVLSFKMIILNKRFSNLLIPTRSFYVLLMAIALSLFITGAGAFAFDLPF